MKQMQITFKSGAQVTVDCDEVTVSRSRVDHTLEGLKWTTPDGWKSRLMAVELQEIACVVVLK